MVALRTGMICRPFWDYHTPRSAALLRDDADNHSSMILLSFHSLVSVFQKPPDPENTKREMPTALRTPAEVSGRDYMARRCDGVIAYRATSSLLGDVGIKRQPYGAAKLFLESNWDVWIGQMQIPYSLKSQD